MSHNRSFAVLIECQVKVDKEVLFFSDLSQMDNFMRIRPFNFFEEGIWFVFFTK